MLNPIKTFCNMVQSGDSIPLFIVILVISVTICFIITYKNPPLVRDWCYEPIVPIPKSLQQNPIVRKWFDLTRGPHYGAKHDRSFKWKDYFTQPLPKMKYDMLFSGWAFAHFVEFFLLAFLCPKLAPISLMLGIVWEAGEALMQEHCVLDVFWNMCGCLFGLLVRSFVLPY
jgi:hypothetical protein